ncbi:hypothetical protein MtrunA17_Chr1g0203391 [Medicago truncatula]|uniref:Uncharacterized protein n=1 Tax=Medicago truncatula TaxID=3880 RepID=A0A396K0G3_MEDTR|nr:hypothetical protein MtrunA17_Chr1g0203391 [Medicago truncatula]
MPNSRSHHMAVNNMLVPFLSRVTTKTPLFGIIWSFHAYMSFWCGEISREGIIQVP